MTDPSLDERCELLRTLHVRGNPLLLPNAWDVASARVVETAGFPVVATTSGGVAATLGYEDHEGAPAEEMLAAAGRIVRGVALPVTVDAEAGYGMGPVELASALRQSGAAGCNLEDSDHATGKLRDRDRHADWLRAVREAAAGQDYPLVVNARIDVFLAAARSGENAQADFLADALQRAEAYAEAGADCVYPIALWQRDALDQFLSAFPGPVNVLRIPPAPSVAELAELGVARVSWGGLLHGESMEQLRRVVATLSGD